MTASSFRIGKGDLLVIDDIRHEIVQTGPGGVSLRSLDRNSKLPNFTNEELSTLYFDRRLKIERKMSVRLPEGVARALITALEAFSSKDQAEALRRLDYVNLCERYFEEKRAPRTLAGYAWIGRVCARLRRGNAARDAGRRISEIGLEHVGGSTLREWHWRWRDAGRSVNALVPLHHRKGGVITRDPIAMDLVRKAVETRWLSPERPPLRKVIEAIEHEIEFDEHLDVMGRPVTLRAPSESTIRRWVRDNVDDYTATFHREGEKAAEKIFKSVRRAPQPIRPLQMVEVDHTPIDLMLVRDPVAHAGKKTEGLDRAWLTVAICATTRMIFGFHIGFEKPSWISVMNCLAMGVLPKDDLLEVEKIEGSWPVFGLPEILVVDNGKEFHSNSMKAAAGQLGFELRYTPRRRPHLKGKVERLLGEVARDFTSLFPGRTFANTQERGGYDSAGKAALTLDQLRTLFLKWVVGIHHNRPHRGLMLRAPLQRWNELAGYGVRLPPEAGDLTAYFGRVVDKAIQRKGIENEGLFYRSDELSAMKRRPGKSNAKWCVKGDPYDLSSVFVLDEDEGRWIEVPSVDPELTDGLTLADYRIIVDETKRKIKDGARIHVSALKAARRELLSDGQRLGAGVKAPTVPFEKDWYRDNVETLVVQVGHDGEADVPDPITERRLKVQRGAYGFRPNMARGPQEEPNPQAASKTVPAARAEDRPVVDDDRPAPRRERPRGEV